MGQRRQGQDKERSMDYQVLTTLVVVMLARNGFTALMLMALLTAR